MLHFSQTRSQNSTEHSFTTNITYSIGQRHLIKTEYTFTHGEFASLWGNLNKHSFKLIYSYLLTLHTKVYLLNTYSLNRYTTSLDYEVYKGGVGIKHSFTPHISIEVIGGMFLFQPEEGDQLTGFSEKMRVNYIRKRSQFSLSAEKGVREVLFTTLNLNFSTYWSITVSFTHKLTPNLIVSASSSYNKSNYKFIDRKDAFWTTSLRFDYTPRRWFSTYISYDYSTLDTNIASYNYDVNRVVLGLRFVY
jgi:predicted porin